MGKEFLVAFASIILVAGGITALALYAESKTEEGERCGPSSYGDCKCRHNYGDDYVLDGSSGLFYSDYSCINKKTGEELPYLNIFLEK